MICPDEKNNFGLLLGFLIGTAIGGFLVFMLMFFSSLGSPYLIENKNSPDACQQQILDINEVMMHHPKSINSYKAPRMITRLDIFSQAMCSAIIRTGEQLLISDSSNIVMKPGSKRVTIQKGHIPWLYERALKELLTLNKKYWRDLLPTSIYSDYVELVEYVQETVFTAEKEDWHNDIDLRGSSAQRKFTIVIQLSPKEDYDGGIMEHTGNLNHIIPIPTKQGSILIFQSFSLHRMTPITKGIRRSLILRIASPYV